MFKKSRIIVPCPSLQDILKWSSSNALVSTTKIPIFMMSRYCDGLKLHKTLNSIIVPQAHVNNHILWHYNFMSSMYGYLEINKKKRLFLVFNLTVCIIPIYFDVDVYFLSPSTEN